MEYFKELDTAIYQNYYTLRQDDAGGGDIVIYIKADNGTRLLITNIIASTSNLTANRRVDIDTEDSSGQRLLNLALDTSVATGSWLNIPSTGLVANADNNKSNIQVIPMVNGDRIRIRMIGAAQNELLKFGIRGYIRGRLPSVDTSGSGGVISVSASYARIV